MLNLSLVLGNQHIGFSQSLMNLQLDRVRGAKLSVRAVRSQIFSQIHGKIPN